MLSTGRNLAVSWCLGAILPNPQGPGGVIDEELEAINLERYEGFRAGLERATRIWERHSKMNLVHLAGLDDRRKPSGGSCDTALEHIWFRAQTRKCNFDTDGEHTTLPMDQDGWRIPIPGHFRSRTHLADIIWFDPRDASLDRWRFTQDYSVLKSGPGSAALLGVVEATEYLPIVGNFDGDNRTDMFWYTPGSAADWLWLSTSNQEAMLFDSYEFAVDGEYLPIVGDLPAPKTAFPIGLATGGY